MTELRDVNQAIIEEFRANHGVVGGGFADMRLVLLTTTGARSGQRRVKPLATLPGHDGVLYVFASKAGAPSHPDWYYNLLAHPEVEVEFGDERFAAVATPLEGVARDRIYAEQAARVPAFAEYQQKTDRVIPVVELRRAT